MAPAGDTSQGRHRQLIMALRQAREERGLTQREVADALEWSVSKLIRIEKGSVGISVTDVKALLLHYEITDTDDVEQMTDLARASKKAVWWQQYREVMPQNFFTFIELEASSVRTRQFQNLFVPGILQSPAYIEALLRIVGSTPEQAKRGLDVRLKRQDLISEGGPEFLFIIDESVLRRVVGDNEVMRDQMLKLKEAAAHPQVSIQIMPFTAGPHLGMSDSFEILELSHERGDYALWVDHSYKNQLIQVPDDETRQFVAHFSDLEKLALPASETPKFIDARLEEIATG